MDVVLDDIRMAAEDCLPTAVSAVELVADPTVNRLFKIMTDDDAYIFKVFAQKTWPEDGKLAFVNRCLRDNDIPCAELLHFGREDPRFPNGYALERFVAGKTANTLVMSPAETASFYGKLAGLVSRFHRLGLVNYGYIGHGTALYERLRDYIGDVADENIAVLVAHRRLDPGFAAAVKEALMDILCRYAHLPPVLCHGDISKKNIIVGAAGGLTLIDWDDAVANIWPADFSGMTYKMHFHYTTEDYRRYRGAFLDLYETCHPIPDLDTLEKAFRLFYGLDIMVFHLNNPAQEEERRYLEQTLGGLL
jgi:Ser/Thr protein kinase RdoA (MazF antagonist)